MRRCRICGGSTTLFSRVPDRDQPDQRQWEVWRCSKCAYGFTHPDLSEVEMGSYYPPAYLGDTFSTLDAFLTGQLQKTRSWRREMEKRAFVGRFCAGGRILDVGASNASFLLALDPERWRRVGVERIGPVVEAVRSKIPDLEFFQGDLFTAPLSTGSFNLVTFWHVFEHLEEPHEVLARTAEVLKPGGIVVLSVPRFDSYQARLFGLHWYALDLPRHRHHFSRRSLEILLQDSGFQVAGHYFFSRLYNIHQLKHSVIHWAEARFGSRLPYYLLKPALMAVPWFEALGDGYGALTTVARRT